MDNKIRNLFNLYFLFLLLAVASSCRDVNPEIGLYKSGFEAQKQGNLTKACEQYSLAIEEAIHTDPPRFFEEAYLERGKSRLAMVRFWLNQNSDFSTSNYSLENKTTDSFPALSAALDDFNKIIENTDSSSSPIYLNALRFTAEIYEIQGNDPSAEKAYRLLLKVAPSHETDLIHIGNLQLGWLFIRRIFVEIERKRSTSELDDEINQALSFFNNALELNPGDHSSMLGQGICHAKRGQFRESFDSLKKSLGHTDALNIPNPLAHFYHALCIEKLQGYQTIGVNHLYQAVEDDKDRNIFELYSHLAKTLLIYFPLSDPKFVALAKSLLANKSNRPTYWSDVEDLFEQLLDPNTISRETFNGEPFPKEIAYRGRALARAKIGKIDGAIEDLLNLPVDNNFFIIFNNTFPVDSSSPGIVYARLRVLYSIGQYKKVEELTAGGISVDPISEYYYRIDGLIGLNLFAQWKETIAVDPKLEEDQDHRDKFLLNARKTLFRFLQRFSTDIEARIQLGELMEIVNDTETALFHYCNATQFDTSNIEAHERLIRLHQKENIGDPSRYKVWKCLKKFEGESKEIDAYIQKITKEIKVEISQYCQECGRKAANGEENACLICGRELGYLAAEKPERK